MNSVHVLFVVLSIVTTLATDSFPRCDSIPLVPVDFEKDMVANSPLYVLQTNQNIYPCARLLFIKPTPGKGNYTGSGVIIEGNYTFSYDANLTGSTFNAQLCSKNVKIRYSIFYNTLRTAVDEKEGGICALECASDGKNYTVLNCAGRTKMAYGPIQTYLDTHLHGVPGIINAQKNCSDPEFCKFFTN